jgi:hydrogenase nickel incorporation protein HypB
VNPVLAAVEDHHEGHLLVVPERKSKHFNSGRYEPQTWIDLHYSETREGVPLKFAKYDKRWNKFRAWFSPAGVGIGIFASPGKAGYQGRLSVFSPAVPDRFVDRKPSNQDWEDNHLRLRGMNGRCHIYLADWWPRFENDGDFLAAIADCWSILGETLVKTVLAPMFTGRALKVLAWQGYNMLGNRDGEGLDDPALGEPTKVIEGDQETANDAERIRETGVPAVQINTGGACHLDAVMLQNALSQIDLENTYLLIIENVGNLICPFYFPLGAEKRVLVVSVAEGEDKFVKHPMSTRLADVIVINKVDLTEAVGVDIGYMEKTARELNPRAPIIRMVAKRCEGIGELRNALGI